MIEEYFLGSNLKKISMTIILFNLTLFVDNQDIFSFLQYSLGIPFSSVLQKNNVETVTATKFVLLRILVLVFV